MSKRSSMVALFAIGIIFSGVAHAAANTSSINNTKLEDNGWYRVKRLTNLKPQIHIGGEANENAPANNLVLVPGTEFTVLDMSADGQYVRIGIDEDITEYNPGVSANDPIAVWVLRSELMATEPQYVDMAALDLFEDMGVDIDLTLEEQAWWEESGLIGHVRKKKSGGMTYCLRDVRTTALKYTSAKNIPQGISRAAIAYPAYKAKGWKPVAYSSKNTNGTACFYGGGRMDCCTKSNSKGKCIARGACGHAAIKIGANKWKGAGIRPVPQLPNKKGKVYIAQGCLTPPPR